MDISKCKFKVIKVKFLGLIIIIESVRFDSAKLEVVVNWHQLQKVKDIQ